MYFVALFVEFNLNVQRSGIGNRRSAPHHRSQRAVERVIERRIRLNQIQSAHRVMVHGFGAVVFHRNIEAERVERKVHLILLLAFAIEKRVAVRVFQRHTRYRARSVYGVFFAGNIYGIAVFVLYGVTRIVRFLHLFVISKPDGTGNGEFRRARRSELQSGNGNFAAFVAYVAERERIQILRCFRTFERKVPALVLVIRLAVLVVHQLCGRIVVFIKRKQVFRLFETVFVGVGSVGSAIQVNALVRSLIIISFAVDCRHAVRREKHRVEVGGIIAEFVLVFALVNRLCRCVITVYGSGGAVRIRIVEQAVADHRVRTGFFRAVRRVLHGAAQFIENDQREVVGVHVRCRNRFRLINHKAGNRGFTRRQSSDDARNGFGFAVVRPGERVFAVIARIIYVFRHVNFVFGSGFFHVVYGKFSVAVHFRRQSGQLLIIDEEVRAVFVAADSERVIFRKVEIIRIAVRRIKIQQIFFAAHQAVNAAHACAVGSHVFGKQSVSVQIQIAFRRRSKFPVQFFVIFVNIDRRRTFHAQESESDCLIVVGFSREYAHIQGRIERIAFFGLFKRTRVRRGNSFFAGTGNHRI